MKVSATTLVLAAAIGVAARPSGHGHKEMHRSLEKRLDFVMNKKPEAPIAIKAPAPSAPAPVAAPVQPPPPPPPPAFTPAQAKPASSPPKPSSGGAKKKFCGGNSKRATIAQIAYKGNLGAPENYGCNMMMVDDADGYDYTATIENKSGKDQTCVGWLKIGPDGGINGFQKGNEVLKFDLPAHSKKVVAAEANTQGAISCGAGSVQTNPYGQWASTWLEMDFANESNGGYSGADISCLVAADSNLPIQAMTVCADGAPTCSVIHNGGSGTNAYVAKTHALDGVGLNLTPGPVNLKVTVG